MINIFFKFWKIGSLIVLTLTVLFCYTNLPESIAISHDSKGQPIGFITKEQFFYWTVGIIFALNFFMSLLEGALLKINFKGLNSNSAWANSSEALKNLLKGWFSAFLALVNTYLVFVILGLNNINSRKAQTLDFNYNWLIILGAVILMILLFIVPIRLLFTNPPAED